MLVGIFLLVISAGAVAAGVGYIRTAKRMRTFATTTGTIVERKVGRMATVNQGGPGDPAFGKGGNFTVQVAYTYEVGGQTHRSDKYSYATKGWRSTVAQEKLDAIPDQVQVHYNPASPDEAYLELNTPTTGYWLTAGGVLGALIGLALIAGS